MPSKNTDVVVIEVEGECRVRPAVYVTDSDHREFRIRNLTNWDVTVLLPPDLVEGESLQVLNLRPGGEKKSRGETVLNHEADGVYHYEVIWDQARHDGNWRAGERGGRRRRGFALGESDPIVVVDPPPGLE